MNKELAHKLKRLTLPGLKRYILFVLLGVFVVVFGVLLVLGFHPITVTGDFIRECLEHAADVLPHRISGILAITVGIFLISIAFSRTLTYVVASYLPEDRESIPDMLLRRAQSETGPRIVVIGGGTGLANLLTGLKAYTNNLTAIVTVGDDGGSSGRLREELGVLPPGDIRNCITALADEEKLVTELFRYRFASGQGLEGHSFGNLFLTALCEITHGDMLQAVKVASRVLNSRGQVLPSTLNSITLVAEMEDGRKVHGESHIAGANGHIKRMTCEPANPEPAPEAIDVIMNADLVVLGPGSLYTSIIPNMLVQGISEAIRQTAARRIYVCNVMTEAGETTNYTVGDHVEALLEHSSCDVGEGYKFVDAVLVNEDIPEEGSPDASPNFVTYDPNHVRDLGVRPIKRNVVSHNNPSQHDANQLAEALILWYTRRKRSKRRNGKAIPFRRRVASLF